MAMLMATTITATTNTIAWIKKKSWFLMAVVAMNPMPAEQCGPGETFTLHALSAVVFFLCLAVVAIGFSKGRIRYIIHPPQRRRFTIAYNIAGTAMIAMPAAVVALHFLSGGDCANHWVFWVECLGIAAFSFYWFVKTLEYQLLLKIEWRRAVLRR